MRKLITILLIAVIAVSSVAFVASNKVETKVDNRTDEFISLLEETKSYTIELAEAMPADKYTFKPHDSVRSFGEQLAHVGMSSKFLLDLFIKGEPMPGPEVFANMGAMEKSLGANKEECIKTLNASFKAIKDAYAGMTDEQKMEKFKVPFDPAQPEFTKERGFAFIKDHMIHHRGQALVALRMQGIKAPAYKLY